jgi:nucleotide-binding universal stress UspA family protein
VLGAVRRIAAPGASVSLLRVLPSVPDNNAALATLEDDLGAVGPRYNLCAEPVVAVGRASDQVLLQAMERDVELIAMTIHTTSALRELVGGSEVDPLVSGSSCPLLLARPDMKEPAAAIHRILVPLDGTEESESVLESVAGFAREMGAELVMMHVSEVHFVPAPAPDLPPAMGGLALPMDSVERRAFELSERGMHVQLAVSDGDPAGEILRKCETMDADLIAIAARRRRGLSRLMGGGTVWRRLLRRSPKPVWLQPIG